MLSMSRPETVAPPSGGKLFHLKRLAQSLVIGAGASFLCLGTSSHAAEQIILRFESTEVTISVANLDAFARGGNVQSSDLQDFLQKNPRVQEILRTVLTKEIAVGKAFSGRFFQSSTGEFVLTQLDKLISSPAPTASLENLRTAIVSSFEDDNRFSILELINRYPGPSIRLDVSVLERVYNDVSAFVERIQPALEAVKGVLQDFICDCEKRSALELTPGAASTAQPGMALPISVSATEAGANCVKPQAAADVTAIVP